jgi:two-component system sensor histidine kinase PilS (NtrC family)
MADGALVVDRHLRVRASNPAARSLLAARGSTLGATFQLRGRAEWSDLAQAVQRALDDGRWPDGGEDVQVNFGGGDVRALRLRVRFARRRSGPRETATGGPFGVLLLEDARSAQSRMRQERLAAMGRVSAGIAHEIRNPLAAIAQANALLLEDPLSDAQTRLARIVADNVERLRRIVDDVMAVAPGAAPMPDAIDATEVIGVAASDWAQTAGLLVGGRLRLDLPRTPLHVAFDAEHLRRVLVNLLDNALRHASEATGAIGLRLAARDSDTALLLVDSDGPPIEPEVERHLFEPFFSTRSRGTGLGLFICRELCQRYGATVEYRLRGDTQRNLFLVIMPRGKPTKPGRGKP